MKQWTGETAAAHILDAPSAADLFAECGGQARKVTRLYRVLAFAVHPDRAALEGIDIAVAEQATIRLNSAHDAIAAGPSTPTPAAAPHVIGDNGTYQFGDRLLVHGNIATYLTDRDLVRIEIARDPSENTAVHTLLTAAPALASGHLGAFAPEVLDSGITDGRAWVAYRLPEGLRTLREVKRAYPDGLDGRDWAWMARRLWMVLTVTGHGNLTLDTVHIHPEQHGVVLTGFTDAATGRDADGMYGLFKEMLSRAEGRQRTFGALASRVPLPADQALREYDTLLHHMYGQRRFRPFTVPTTTT